MDKATEIIIELRTQRGLSARQLESSANLSNASIQAWKSGKARPSVDALVKLSDYFGVSVDFLLGHEVQEKKSSLTERPAYDIAEKFVSEFGSLLSEKNFIDFTKLYNVMNENQKTFLLARTIGMLNGQGINTQAIVGY